MPVKTIADLLDIGDDRIWRVLEHCKRSIFDKSDWA
jgi:transposase